MARSITKAVRRRFIRHPSRMPISFDLRNDNPPRDDYLRNVSDGGLCFASARPLDAGTPIRLGVPVFGERFEIDATVVWSREVGRGYEIGVAFEHQQDRFAIRMVEQLCYIEDYRIQVEREQGRTMSSEQAAREWVERFAGDFPEPP